MSDKIREYYDTHLEDLSRVKPRHQLVFKSIDKYIPPYSKVLDIGCGAGIISRYLSYGNRDVIGIDISPVLIGYAEKYNSHFKSIKYYVSDIIDCEFTEKFDAVMLVDVLEHIQTEKLTYLFNTLYEITHKDSVIYVNIPSSDRSKYTINNQKKQIVENIIETGDVIKMFYDIGFIPIYYRMYWGQYVEFLFVTESNYHRQIRDAENKRKQSKLRRGN